MSTIAEHRAKLRARKAAALGMSLEQFDAHVAAEQARIDAIRRAMYDRPHSFFVIGVNANFFNRSFTKLG